MSTPNGNSSVPPFIEEEKEHPHPPPEEIKVSEPANSIVMAVGWGILTIALVGGAKVLWDILSDGMGTTSELWAKVIALSVAFIVGWVVSLVSIRVLHNLILPFVIRLYALVVALGIAGIYLRVAFKLLSQDFDPTKHYLRYSIVLTGLLFVLAGLHLLIEEHDIRPFCIPILLAALFHLVAIVTHYVFMPASKSTLIVGDLYFFIFSLILAVLVAKNLPFVKPLQRAIDNLLPTNGSTS